MVFAVVAVVEVSAVVPVIAVAAVGTAASATAVEVDVLAVAPDELISCLHSLLTF